MSRKVSMPHVEFSRAIFISSGLLMAFGGQSHAAAIIDPNTQPALSLAPYVAKSDDLSLGATHAYRPWFENGAWQGDIIEYDIGTDGSRSTDVQVGENPAHPGTDNWSARAQFDSAEVLDNNWWKTRPIYTRGGNGSTVSFLWDALSEEQKLALDPDTAGNATLNRSYDSPVLNYIRGDRSLERDEQFGIYRIRYNILGAIINSRPAYSAYMSGGDPYSTERLYVGANDGMLHAFDAKTGDEVWAYVPSMLFPKLERHGIVPYNIVYMVDGELRLSSVVTSVVNGIPTRKRILAGGLGAGGKGLFALNVDDPDEPLILWELSDGDPDIGYVHGRPNIAPIQSVSGREASIIAGNGYGSVNGKAVLLKVGLDGSVVKIVVDAGPGNGLSPPSLIDINNDGLVDLAYAGDLKGNLWKIDLRSDAVTKLFAAGEARPITVEPEIARLASSNIMIYFGTGSLLSSSDAKSVDRQAIFAIEDRGGLVTESELLVQTLSEATAYEKRLRVSSDQALDRNEYSGWKVELPVESERLVGRPLLRGDRLQFVSIVTSGAYPEGWLNQLNYLTGGGSGVPLFDIDDSGALGEGDAVIFNESAKYPVGRFLGIGNFSQPMLLRLGQGLDVSFVNGLRLPLPPSGQGLLFGGDIDVTTDSPSGPAVEPAPPYPNPDGIVGAPDGLGGNVDGHVHAYDKIHGVTYVDVFDLEPRLGLARLDAALSSPEGEPIVVAPELSRVTENSEAPGTTISGFDVDQKFIVGLTNADLSKGVTLQVGCRTWNAYEYQNMLTEQLLRSVQPNQLQDTLHGNQSLVFTLRQIRDATCEGGKKGTLRLTVEDRVGKDGVLHATLPGCVNNTTDYTGAEKVPETHPHITPVQERSAGGYRWRNGALTLQLLKVDDQGLRDFELQNSAQLPTYSKGNGGVYASAFSVSGKTIIPLPGSGSAENGLLYELSMFWHHGDMYDYRNSGPAPVCYGHPRYNANTAIDLGGVTLGEYNELISEATRALIEEEYAAALASIAAALASGDEEALRIALRALGVLLGENPDLALYHAMRGYAPGHVPVQHLLEIDRQLGDGSGGVALDQTPAEVDDVSQDDNPTRGPNFVTGRRTWIDLQPHD